MMFLGGSEPTGAREIARDFSVPFRLCHETTFDCFPAIDAGFCLFTANGKFIRGELFW